MQLTMKRDEKRPKWWYEETDPAGVDYSSAELVQRYDDRHQKLRETHIREEYSTYDWVMEGLLARAGFEIKSAEYRGRFQATYVCAKSGPWIRIMSPIKTAK